MVLALSKPTIAELVEIRRSRIVALQPPRLSVVIVNYHQWDNTATLVKQLLKSRALRRQTSEVMIVDNRSPAHPVVSDLRRCSGVSLLRWGKNRGFARAVNEGCRLSQGDWILLLNPDMSLPTGFLDRVLRLSDRLTRNEERAGIIGLGLRNQDGTRQLSAGAFPTLWSTLSRLAEPRSRRKYHEFSDRKPSAVDWVTGCGMLIRRECLHEVGGLDQDYFLYYEDVDLCRRAREKGWSVWYEPNIEAVHHSPLHERNVSAPLRVVTRHSLLMYGLKHWPRWQFRALASIVRREARMRQLLARRNCQTHAAGLFGELHQITDDLVNGNVAVACKRVRRLAYQQQFYSGHRKVL